MEKSFKRGIELPTTIISMNNGTSIRYDIGASVTIHKPLGDESSRMIHLKMIHWKMIH